MTTTQMTTTDDLYRCDPVLTRALYALARLRDRADRVCLPDTPWSRDRDGVLSWTMWGQEALFALLRAAGPRVAGAHPCYRPGRPCAGTAISACWDENHAPWLVNVAWDCGCAGSHKPGRLTLLDPGEAYRAAASAEVA